MSDKTRPARLAGITRQPGLGRNRLRRRIDLLQAWIMAGLLSAFLAGSPLVATAVGGWMHPADLREQRVAISIAVLYCERA